MSARTPPRIKRRWREYPRRPPLRVQLRPEMPALEIQEPRPPQRVLRANENHASKHHEGFL
jgi:hypothetical protein